jgi:hypothetical protein
MVTLLGGESNVSPPSVSEMESLGAFFFAARGAFFAAGFLAGAYGFQRRGLPTGTITHLGSLGSRGLLLRLPRLSGLDVALGPAVVELEPLRGFAVGHGGKPVAGSSKGGYSELRRTLKE